jgi:hypothetical protein
MSRLLLFLLLAVLLGCNWMDTGDPPTELASLYRQRIANSKYVLYEFTYPGTFVTTSDYTGVTILDSTLSFSRSRIDKLPCAYFTTKPTISELKLLHINMGQTPRMPKDTLMVPSKHYSQRFNGVRFDITEYSDTYGSATMDTGLMEYGFSRLKETSDSLVFYGVTRQFGGRDFPATTAFAKGNIRVEDSARSYIQYIGVEQAVMKRGAIYKPTAPLQLVANQPIVGTAFYRFYPKKRLRFTVLTDLGIWKRVK